MTKREAAIVSAYTGVLVGEFGDLHAYIEEIMGRPVFTHQLGDQKMANAISKAAKADFVSMKVEG